MMQVYDMKINLFERMLCSPRSIAGRTKIKVALKHLKDWFNQPSYEQHADCQSIDERIREQRLKYESYRFPHIF
ncbi:MAG: hypothetical protein IT288_16750 [Bdellovibrionales bacterium]|nr:hypothetical protein [Bdellovibrionales bacterium]